MKQCLYCGGKNQRQGKYCSISCGSMAWQKNNPQRYAILHRRAVKNMQRKYAGNPKVCRYCGAAVVRPFRTCENHRRLKREGRRRRAQAARKG